MHPGSQQQAAGKQNQADIQTAGSELGPGAETPEGRCLSAGTFLQPGQFSNGSSIAKPCPNLSCRLQSHFLCLTGTCGHLDLSFPVMKIMWVKMLPVAGQI